MKASFFLLILAQTAFAVKCKPRGGLNPDNEKTRDDGKSEIYNKVWWPLPQGFNQAQPDNILAIVEKQSSLQHFGNTLAYNRVVVFGDSSSDTNNQFRATNGAKPSPQKYWQGRVSNGPMWPDYLEKHYGISLTNFAYGGATVNNQVFSQGGKFIYAIFLFGY